MTQNEIVVTVHGGVVQDVQFPTGCRTTVAVHDFDTNGTDDAGLPRDEQGEAFVEAHWEPTDKAPVPDAEGEPEVPVGVAFLDALKDAEAKSILAQIYGWLYWEDDRKSWSPDKEISGADTVEFLCELLPRPSQDDPTSPGGGP